MSEKTFVYGGPYSGEAQLIAQTPVDDLLTLVEKEEIVSQGAYDLIQSLIHPSAPEPGEFVVNYIPAPEEEVIPEEESPVVDPSLEGLLNG